MSLPAQKIHLIKYQGGGIEVAETWCSKRGYLHGFHSMRTVGGDLVVTEDKAAVTCRWCLRHIERMKP